MMGQKISHHLNHLTQGWRKEKEKGIEQKGKGDIWMKEEKMLPRETEKKEMLSREKEAGMLLSQKEIVRAY